MVSLDLRESGPRGDGLANRVDREPGLDMNMGLYTSKLAMGALPFPLRHEVLIEAIALKGLSVYGRW